MPIRLRGRPGGGLAAGGGRRAALRALAAAGASSLGTLGLRRPAEAAYWADGSGAYGGDRVDQRLTVHKASDHTKLLVQTDGSAWNPGLQLERGSADLWEVGVDGAQGDLYVWDGDAGRYAFRILAGGAVQLPSEGLTPQSGQVEVRVSSGGHTRLKLDTPSTAYNPKVQLARGGTADVWEIGVQGPGGDLYVWDNDGGQFRLYVSGSGSVGVGTAAPATALDVAGAARVAGNVTVAGDPAGAHTKLAVTTGGPAWNPALQLVRGPGDLWEVGVLGDQGDLYVWDGDAARFRLYVTSSGLVGVGTPAPVAALDVIGDVRASGPLRLAGAGDSRRVTVGPLEPAANREGLVSVSGANAGFWFANQGAVGLAYAGDAYAWAVIGGVAKLSAFGGPAPDGVVLSVDAGGQLKLGSRPVADPNGCYYA